MNQIYKALAEFQQDCPAILKETTGHNYKYADLPAILAVINPLLKDKGLGFYQLVNVSTLETVVFHAESGESIKSNTYLPVDGIVYEEVTKKGPNGDYVTNVIKGFEGMNKAQAIGSLITYFRRYALSAILGIVTEMDTDGTGVKTGSGKKEIDDLEL